MSRHQVTSRSQFIRFLLSMCALAVVCVLLSGCSSIGKQWKSLVSGKDGDSSGPKAVTTPRFSEQENLRVGSTDSDKQYRRMNRQRFEEESDLKENAGSLWVMEGQGAYLFAQNQTRMIGDLLNVKIEGSPRSQLQTKVKVISKLLERLDGPTRGMASVPGQPAPGTSPSPPPNPAAGPTPPPNTASGQASAEDPKTPGAQAADPFNVQTVPTRIVEQLKDGSYRVRGMQQFMIGKREYKVIVTGVVRAEDFDDNGIDAGKLLDPQFDIVSARKGALM